MYRHPPVKNQRSKGSKIKQVLQICLLVAICFWLIFQVKRYHDKKIEFKASDTKISVSTKGSDEIITLGRKDLQPKLDGKNEEIEKHDEEDDEHEERVTGEDEEKDDQSQSQSQTEIERSLDDRNQDGVARNTHEAREEHYKADDASSAVTHDAQTISNENENENENGTLGDSHENVEVKILEHEIDKSQDSTIKTGDSTLIDETQNSKETKGNSDFSNTENLEEVQDDTSDSTDLSALDLKEDETDLGTLPEMETEDGNSEDTAAE